MVSLNSEEHCAICYSTSNAALGPQNPSILMQQGEAKKTVTKELAMTATCLYVLQNGKLCRASVAIRQDWPAKIASDEQFMKTWD